MRDFTMSMYRSKEDLYKDKANYWEEMFDALLDQYNKDTSSQIDKEEYYTWIEDIN